MTPSHAKNFFACDGVISLVLSKELKNASNSSRLLLVVGFAKFVQFFSCCLFFGLFCLFLLFARRIKKTVIFLEGKEEVKFKRKREKLRRSLFVH